MPDVHGEYALWLRWFLSSENTDEAALRAALRVVPNEFWPAVQRDISRGLSELSAEDEGDAGAAPGGLAATFRLRRPPTLELKSALLAQVGRRRDAS